VPFRGPNPALASYQDAVSVHDVFTRAQADLALFSPADQALLTGILTSLTPIVQAGPGAFDQADVGVVLGAALNGIDALTRLPCQKF
jgi:hypothetical protein